MITDSQSSTYVHQLQGSEENSLKLHIPSTVGPTISMSRINAHCLKTQKPNSTLRTFSLLPFLPEKEKEKKLEDQMQFRLQIQSSLEDQMQLFPFFFFFRLSLQINSCPMHDKTGDTVIKEQR